MKSHCNYKWEWLGSACLFLTCNYYKVYHFFIARPGESQYCSSARNDELPAECTGLTGVNQKLIKLGAGLSARELNLTLANKQNSSFIARIFIYTSRVLLLSTAKRNKVTLLFFTRFAWCQAGGNQFHLPFALCAPTQWFICQTFQETCYQFNKHSSMCLTIIVLNSHCHGTRVWAEDLFWITLYYLLYHPFTFPANTWTLPKCARAERQN